MIREIPNGAVEIQTGLYVYDQQKIIGGNTYTFRYLYSSDGYCFYDNEEEIYDEEGNLIPPEDVLPTQRTYSQYCGLAISMSSLTYEQLNARFISVPVDPSYEIVSVTNPSVKE